MQIKIAGSNSIGLSHRNVDEDITHLNRPALFNTTLRQQGLFEFTDMMQKGDRWRHRQFGMVVSGCKKFVLSAGGDDCKSILAANGITAAEPAQITISTLSRQTKSSEAWEDEIARQHQDHVLKAALLKTSHDSFWATFWNQSHIWVSSKITVVLPELDAALRPDTILAGNTGWYMGSDKV